MAAGGLVDIVEAAYAPAETEQAWVDHIAALALPVLDEGLGLSAFTFDASAGQLRVLAMAAPGLPEEFRPRVAAESTPQPFVPQFFRPSPPALLLSECVGVNCEMRKLVEGSHAPVGIRDVIGIRGSDPSLRGCLLAVALPERRSLPPRRRAQLAKLAAHLASGWRLRLTQEAETRLDAADAVFDQRGKLEHLGDGLDARGDGTKLAAAVERYRAAHRARRLDPEAALDLWRALAAGRWSIVSTTDSDGKRFLLARRNAPRVRDLKALTREESMAAAYAALGHSGKLISYELGLAPSSVSALLKGAMRKLGVKSVAELALLFAP